MRKTKIEWTEHTINPFPGCTKVSEGCRNCYAERMAVRLDRVRSYADIVTDGRWNGSVVDRSAEAKRQLDRIKGPATVFLNSMGDLFHEAISDAQRDLVYGWMLERLDLTFQVLTKRPDNAARYYSNTDLFDRLNEVARCLQNKGPGEPFCVPLPTQAHGMVPGKWPIPNLWFGWTTENQDCYDKRTRIGLQVPAAVRFVSAEPLLGPINLNLATPCDRNCNEYSYAECSGTTELCIMQPHLDWVIIGCESGPKRRPCETKWVQAIIEQCHDADVPVFAKQIRLGRSISNNPLVIAAELNRRVEDIRQWPKVRT